MQAAIRRDWIQDASHPRAMELSGVQHERVESSPSEAAGKLREQLEWPLPMKGGKLREEYMLCMRHAIAGGWASCSACILLPGPQLAASPAR